MIISFRLLSFSKVSHWLSEAEAPAAPSVSFPAHTDASHSSSSGLSPCRRTWWIRGREGEELKFVGVEEDDWTDGVARLERRCARQTVWERTSLGLMDFGRVGFEIRSVR